MSFYERCVVLLGGSWWQDSCKPSLRSQIRLEQQQCTQKYVKAFGLGSCWQSTASFESQATCM